MSIAEVKICSIESRSEQGATKPFVCRGDDEALYFVKGRSAGYRTCIAEWVAGRLGVLMGLPLPPFAQVEVPIELVRDSVRPDASELGAGVWFGSRKVETLQEFARHQLEAVPLSLKTTLLVFDWWICNEDRKLTVLGGNPNLFWDLASKSLVVLDQNLAFDPLVDIEDFRKSHVFSDSLPLMNEEFMNSIKKRMDGALLQLDTIWKELPEPWLEGGGIDFDMVEAQLHRYKNSSILSEELKP